MDIFGPEIPEHLLLHSCDYGFSRYKKKSIEQDQFQIRYFRKIIEYNCLKEDQKNFKSVYCRSSRTQRL
jgi:uncharacterized protein YwqG